MFGRDDLAWLLPALCAALRDLAHAASQLASRGEAVAAAVGCVSSACCASRLRDALRTAPAAALLSTAPFPLRDALTCVFASSLASWGARGGATPAVAAAQHLASLGAPQLGDAALSSAVGSALRSHVNGVAPVFDAPCLEPARAWLAAGPLPFADCIAAALRPAGGEAALVAARARVDADLCASLGSLRASQLFDIVVDHPASAPAVEDLRSCVACGGVRAPRVGASLCSALSKRLCHAGAVTEDVISAYVSSIGVCAALDGGGEVLRVGASPVRIYLRARKDTIRCVVRRLTADGEPGARGEGGSLAQYLAAPEGGERDGDSDAEGDASLPPGRAWAAWAPPPRAAGAGGAAGDGRGWGGGSPPDVVSLLVDVFGSRDLFVAEYRSLLAARLLGRVGFEAEGEVRTLELLKLRFGEAPFHAAEVMLKDIADSRRIDAHVKGSAAVAGGGGVDRVVCATIASSLFWPPPPPEAAAPLTLPPPVEAALGRVGAAYGSLKAPRTLAWRRHLGCVRLRLTLAGAARDFTVSPLHAALVWRFSERDSWPPELLGAALGGVPPPLLRAKAALWFAAGVLVETSGPRGEHLWAAAHAFGEDTGRAEAAAAHPQDAPDDGAAGSQAAGMTVYEQYVVGMLTNFDALSLDRIHNMLKMFVADPPYDKTAAQLEAFLATLVAADKLTTENGVYRRTRR